MISVCMPTFNGEKYIEEQITSILAQLAPADELIVSDDGSTDSTMAIIEDFRLKDQRIKVFQGPQQGVVRNVSHAIAQSQGEIIFLADQDDVWLPGRVETISQAFHDNPKKNVIVSDLKIVNEELRVIEPSYFAYRGVKAGMLRNILKNGYIGAGMAFRSQLKAKILPIPETIPMHDMWIGLLADSSKSSLFLNVPLTLYRRHGGNTSEIKSSVGFVQKLSWRWNLLFALIKRLLFSK